MLRPKLGYLLINPKGEYLNTDYHSSMRKGDWRADRAEARVYKSKQGIRQAIANKESVISLFISHGVPASIKEKNRWGYDSWANFREQLEAMKKINTDDFFSVLEDNDYTLEVIQ